MFDFLRRIISPLDWRPPRRCAHPNGRESRWIAGDGTPMVAFVCLDCGLSDVGHVYADAETWMDRDANGRWIG